MKEFCIICANGNDLPDGEHCPVCDREGRAIGLRAAVIKARGRQEPPKNPVKFSYSGLVEDVVREVSELPDRNSPEDQPDMLLVTREELKAILIANIAEFLVRP